MFGGLDSALPLLESSKTLHGWKLEDRHLHNLSKVAIMRLLPETVSKEEGSLLQVLLPAHRPISSE